MSVLSATKTNYSVSEVSLGSSALVTAASTYTLSDYETSSEKLSPRAPDDDSRSLARQFSSLEFAVQPSRSSAALASLSDTSGRMLAIRSDGYLSQQSKMIQDFMEDVLRTQRDHLQDAMSSDDSTISIASIPELDAAVGNDSVELSVSQLDVSCAGNEEAIEICRSEEPRPEVSKEDTVEAVENCSLTISETKKKIMENLEQIANKNLFSRSAQTSKPPTPETPSKPLRKLFPIINNTDRDNALIIKGLEIKRPSEHGKISRVNQPWRKFARSNSVESILKIDYELQPLNLMLSRLLAEFRAMNLRGKLSFDPNVCNFDAFAVDSDSRFILQEPGRCPSRKSTLTLPGTRASTASTWLPRRAKTASLSHEPIGSPFNAANRTSRSCDTYGNDRWMEESRRLSTKPSGNDDHPRGHSRHKKHTGPRKQQSSHRRDIARCVACYSAQNDDILRDFRRQILEELAARRRRDGSKPDPDNATKDEVYRLEDFF